MLGLFGWLAIFSCLIAVETSKSAQCSFSGLTKREQEKSIVFQALSGVLYNANPPKTISDPALCEKFNLIGRVVEENTNTKFVTYRTETKNHLVVNFDGTGTPIVNFTTSILFACRSFFLAKYQDRLSIFASLLCFE
jgi:hypothetical protein